MSDAKIPPGAALHRWLRKLYFLNRIAKHHRVIDVGAGSGWVCRHLRGRGVADALGMDTEGQPELHGDVNDWRELGLAPASLDVIVAFEVVEHVDCWQALHDLLRPGGVVLVTTPVPQRDWVMKLLERLGVNQRRTSVHNCLVDLRTVSQLELVEYRHFLGLSQWGILRKRGSDEVGYPAPLPLAKAFRGRR